MKQIEFTLNLSEVEMFLIFQDGMLAKVQKTVIDEGDYWRFYVVPTSATSTMYGLKDIETLDPRFNRLTNQYEFRIKKTWVRRMNDHPAFTRWEVYSLWDLKEYVNSKDATLYTLVQQNEVLKQQRDIEVERTRSILRKIRIQAKHDRLGRKEQTEELFDVASKLNPMIPNTLKREMEMTKQ